MKNQPKAQVWSCGGGTQSAAIAVLILQGKLPKPDIAVIVDTGRETRRTWEYLDGVVNPAMKAFGLEVQRVKAEEWACRYSKINLFDLGRYKGVLIPAYSTLNGSRSKLSNYCTGNWKIETRDNWLNKTQKLTRSHVVTWVGFSTDEPRRYFKMMAGEEFKKGLIRLPLVHDVPTKRWEAIKLVQDFGWPTPPRSACWMCPNHDDDEWRKLMTECPEEFQKAVELEREIRKVDPDLWLHRSCVPLDQVDFTKEPDLFGPHGCDSGQCFT